ncbi:RING-H2 finger protein ATL20-like [Durio zibethinus]|uniref:RING-type E3 ubiquitin transferase n=1 Tax=Durio zibethinus TaxID=66656 RepID=A0A6P6A8H6_DURZI|nr:RING-H2 finger protein ATL20-like [Durio zibethinus]
MALVTFLSFLLLLLFLQKPTTAHTCSTSCAGREPEVKFPFGLNANGSRNGHCSYPGFGLSCSNKTGGLVLNLLESVEFTVKYIDYEAQQILIDDPDNCLSKRFSRSFDESGTPLHSESSYTFTFLNCSDSEVAARLWTIPCLSNQNYSVVALQTNSSVDSFNSLPYSCHLINTVTIPFDLYRWTEGGWLEWYKPDCRSCVERQGDCGFKNRTSQEIGCFINLPSQGGLPRGAKYGITIGVGIPGFLCLIGLVSFVGSRVTALVRRRNLPSFEFSTSISPSLAIFVAGLDGPTIESYPKTKLGDSGRPPKPNDSTCPICLSEYQPKETLRTIPECNHYFHANCIDEWLKMNGSCPLCRNSPGESAGMTPSISSSSSSASLLPS